MYTFWDYKFHRWERDGGLRIDHILVSPALRDRLQDVGVDRDVRGKEGASDHAPVWVELLLAAARIRAYSAASPVMAKEHSLQGHAQCRDAPISPSDSGGTIDLCKRWPSATASGGLRR